MELMTFYWNSPYPVGMYSDYELDLDFDSDIFWQLLRDHYYDSIEGVPFNTDEIRILIDSIRSEQHARSTLHQDDDEKLLDRMIELLQVSNSKSSSYNNCNPSANELPKQNTTGMKRNSSILDTMTICRAGVTYYLPDLMATNTTGSKNQFDPVDELLDVMREFRKNVPDFNLDINEYDIVLRSEIAEIKCGRISRSRKPFGSFRHFGHRFRHFLKKMLCFI